MRYDVDAARQEILKPNSKANSNAWLARSTGLEGVEALFRNPATLHRFIVKRFGIACILVVRRLPMRPRENHPFCASRGVFVA